MDFIFSQNNLYIIIIALVSGAMLLWPTIVKGRGGAAVDLQQAIQMANQQQAVFIDIRPAEQFKTGSIPQARNVPQADLQAKSGTLPKNKPIIVVCDQGRASVQAASALRKQGFEQTFSLQGGLRGWLQGGLPLSKKS